jgi:transcriptional regulator with XRE-family HTH domain
MRRTKNSNPQHPSTEDRPYQEVGARLAALREKEGLGQAELARAIDMSIGNLWRIENGVICPTRDFLLDLRQRYGWDPSFVMFGTPAAARPMSHAKTLDAYANRRNLSAREAALLKQLPWELLGIVGVPSEGEIDRVRMFVETNRALARNKEQRA